jgi:1-acyl-sn-glycerol-3-phosphate acyltransferase
MPAARAVVFLVFQGGSLAFWATLFVITGPFLPFESRYRLAIQWPKMMVWASRVFLGIHYRVLGAEHLPKGPAILLSKHESAWETLFYPAFLPKTLCFVFKRELLWVPFFGWGISLLRMIAIDRGKGTEAFDQILSQSKKVLFDEQRWIVFFPEGTRVLPGDYRRYKTGGTRLSVATGVPVIPVAMNSGDLWPRKSFLKRQGTITVSFGPPLLPESEDATTLMAKVESWISQEMQRISPDRPRRAPA